MTNKVNMTTTLAATAGILLCGIWLTPATADWSQPRGDAARTGTADGVGDLEAPVPYWRYFLGGAIDIQGAIVRDIDGGGDAEVIFVAAGKVLARKSNGAPLWETQPIQAQYLAGTSDLDGDGEDEVVVKAADRAYVLDADSGEIRWDQGEDDFGAMSAVRVGDLDGDGIDDLFVQECHCCGVSNDNTGFGYGFAAGYASPRRLWALPDVECGGRSAMTILDMDGDGKNEITLGLAAEIKLLEASDASGAPARELASIALGTERVAQSMCIPANVDGAPGDELLCALSFRPAGDAGAGHRAFLLRYEPQGPSGGALRLDWEVDIGALDNGVQIPSGALRDLDGDGALEIVLGGTEADGAIGTYVLDARTGAIRAQLPDAIPEATIAAGASGAGAVVLTSRADDVTAWSFTQISGLAPLWTLDDRRVIPAPDWIRVRSTRLSRTALTADLNGDGADELILESARPDDGVYAYDVSGPAPVQRAMRPLSGGIQVIHGWAQTAVSSDGGRVLLATTNGLMSLVDDALFAPAGASIRFGGYYADGDWGELAQVPVLARVAGDYDSVFIRDSRGALLRIDVGDGTLAAPPPAVWEVHGATSPVVLPGLIDGEPAVACRRESASAVATRDVLAMLSARTGAELWRHELPGLLLSDPSPGRFNADDVPDIAVQWGRTSDANLLHRALDGATGAVLWDAPEFDDSTARLPPGASVVDWDGDGIDDVLSHFFHTRVMSGQDGHVIAVSKRIPNNFLPTPYDVDGDGQLEVVLHAGQFAARALETDLQTEMWRAPENRPFPYGSIVACDVGPVLVQGSRLNRSTLTVTRLAGDEVGRGDEVILVGGGLFDRDTAPVKGHGQLTSTFIHTNLLGDGRPIAVIGSSDRWLYGVDPCRVAAGEPQPLAFSVPFDAPVGAAAFGDTDGDGFDEIVVSVADGFLYGLRPSRVLAPQTVWDVIPPSASDVDRIGFTNRMSALWTAVPDADSYEVAILRASDGVFMTDGWRDVGPVTSATLLGLELERGIRYLFVVRALSEGERSPDVWSDGVTVDLTPTPVGGCLCTAGTARGGSAGGAAALTGLVALALMAVLPRRRRRRFAR